VKNKKGRLELASFVCEEGIPVGGGWEGILKDLLVFPRVVNVMIFNVFK
jgi:hypothetical protein